jgi:hypothetical protein
VVAIASGYGISTHVRNVRGEWKKQEKKFSGHDEGDSLYTSVNLPPPKGVTLIRPSFSFARVFPMKGC